VINRTLFGPFHHPLSGDVINNEFDAHPMTEFPSFAHFLEFVLITFGRHLLQLVDESWLVFDSLHIIHKSLAKKSPLCEPEAAANLDPISAYSW
jgi:hypothetical protein